MAFSLSLTPGEKHALFLSMLAGMSTTLGALIAILLPEWLRVRSVLHSDKECDQAGGIREIVLADGAHEDY